MGSPEKSGGPASPLNEECAVHHGRLPKVLRPESAAYIAGLIDGEGTVTLTRVHSNENRRLVVSIANTEIELLNFVLDEFGAGKITRKRSSSDRHTPSFCYSVSSRQALSLLTQILPHLRSYKRQRAELAIRHYLLLTPRNGRYTAELLAERQQFEQALLCVKPWVGDPGNGIAADSG